MFFADLSWILQVSSGDICTLHKEPSIQLHWLEQGGARRTFDIQPKTVYHIPYD